MIDWFIHLPFPSAASYLVLAPLLFFALAYAVESELKRRRNQDQVEAFDQDFDDAVRHIERDRHSVDALRQASRHALPEAAVLRGILDAAPSSLDPLELEGLIGKSLREHAGNDQVKVQRLVRIAPSLGIFGTLFGFQLAVGSFATHADQQLLLANIALAFGTTLGGIVISVIGRLALMNRIERSAEVFEERCLQVAGRTRRLLSSQSATSPGDRSDDIQEAA